MPTPPTRQLFATPEATLLPSHDTAGPLPSDDSLLQALIGAASQLFEFAPGQPCCRVLAYRDSLPPGLIGAYAPVLGNNRGVHVGVLSDVCSCDALARMFDGSWVPTEHGTRTALSAFAQRLACGLVRLSEPAAGLVVGDPVFVDGASRRTRTSGVRAAEVVFALTRATLVLIGTEALSQSAWPGMDRSLRARPKTGT